MQYLKSILKDHLILTSVFSNLFPLKYQKAWYTLSSTSFCPRGLSLAISCDFALLCSKNIIKSMPTLSSISVFPRCQIKKFLLPLLCFIAKNSHHIVAVIQLKSVFLACIMVIYDLRKPRNCD